MKKRKSVLKPEMSNFEMVAVFSDHYYELSDMLVNRLMKVSGDVCYWKLREMESLHNAGGLFTWEVGL